MKLTRAAFEVNGTGIPEVDFDVGESYAGLLPISDAKNETRKLFFWYDLSNSNTIKILKLMITGSSPLRWNLTQKRLSYGE